MNRKKEGKDSHAPVCNRLHSPNKCVSLRHMQKFEENLMRQEANLRETLNIGQDIMKRCHPDAVPVMKQWLSVLRARWEEVSHCHVMSCPVIITLMLCLS